MNDRNDPPRSRDEWRVEVALDLDAVEWRQVLGRSPMALPVVFGG